MNKITEECRPYITSEDYIDLIYSANQIVFDKEIKEDECFINLGYNYRLYFKKIEECGKEEQSPYVKDVFYGNIPFLFTLSGTISSDIQEGIKDYIGATYGEQGKGVVIGIISTGINYAHEAFQVEGKSKILSLWDQTLNGEVEEIAPFGAVYTQEEMNKALSDPNPESVVPSKDDLGFGTFLAGLAAGEKNTEKGSQGIAPEAELIVVKLKEAKQCIKEFFLVPEGGIAYQESDIMMAIHYIRDVANREKKPCVILVPLVSNAGPHNGFMLIEEYMARMGEEQDMCIVVPAGDQASKDHHYMGLFYDKLGGTDTYKDIHIEVKEKNFDLNMFSYLPDRYVVEILSPNGDSTGQIKRVNNQWQVFNITSQGKALVHYIFYEQLSGDQVIHMHFYDVAEGLWVLRVYGEEVVVGRIDIWVLDYYLEKGSFEINFLEPNPYTTLTSPSTNNRTITVGSYNERYNNIFVSSGRGNNRLEQSKPDLVAPGVNLIGPTTGKDAYGIMTGSSCGAAVVAGTVALLMSYQKGKKEAEQLYMNTITIRTYLIRSATRNQNRFYPNRLWGYGELDVAGSITAMEDSLGDV